MIFTVKKFVVVYFGTQENRGVMAAHLYATKKVIVLRKDKE